MKKIALLSILLLTAVVPAGKPGLEALEALTVTSVMDAAFGAKGDGVSDDTQAIQKAVNAVTGTGRTLRVPAGTYIVNAIASSDAGIRLGSDMTFAMEAGAIIKAAPNSAGNYAILCMQGVSNVTITGGTITGERSGHGGTTGEWGHGISIVMSDSISVIGVTVNECWGDGIYISGGAENVALSNVIADHNRRQGLSVTSVDGLVIKDSVFKNTAGTEPECGIDLEPNDGEEINNVSITNCVMSGNGGSGLQIGFNASYSTPRITDIMVDKCSMRGNGVNPAGGGYRRGIVVSHAIGNTTISNCNVSDNLGQGIMIMEGSAGTIISGNSVTGTRYVGSNTTWTGGGIYISESPGSTIKNNIVTGNQGIGIWNCSADASVIITGNTVSGNGE